jgi:hypothetical protein
MTARRRRGTSWRSVTAGWSSGSSCGPRSWHSGTASTVDLAAQMVTTIAGRVLRWRDCAGPRGCVPRSTTSSAPAADSPCSPVNRTSSAGLLLRHFALPGARPVRPEHRERSDESSRLASRSRNGARRRGRLGVRQRPGLRYDLSASDVSERDRGPINRTTSDFHTEAPHPGWSRCARRDLKASPEHRFIPFQTSCRRRRAGSGEALQ